MTSDDSDPRLRRLRHLVVLEPDRGRSERVRVRCHAAIAQRLVKAEESIASRPFSALVLESGLTYGLSIGYLAAMIHDLLRLYMRR